LLAVALVIHLSRTAAHTVALRQTAAWLAVTLCPHTCPASHLHIQQARQQGHRRALYLDGAYFISLNN